PMLPDERKEMYTEKYNLSAYDGEVLTSDMAMADYFEVAASKTKHPKLVANMLQSEIMAMTETDGFACNISPSHMAALADMAGSETINSATVKKLIKRMWENDFDPVEAVEKENLAQVNDEAVILSWVKAAIELNPKSVADYKKGKKTAAKAIIGKAMAVSAGKANPILVQKLVESELDKI
ncbi:MAG: Asp-tRNA(Asn)/Glu-tRNA(Gln) amidotransferase GatCAB subunit B, partial [Clostridia bacterium]|nr:Asp-tRNA(Asn)/Glu-tRNA(Gln) amidotransferase GatCAB subunit B [Clostridia bacterium]